MEYELFYDDVMEGPLGHKFVRRVNATHAAFLVTDEAHVKLYHREPGQPFEVTARLSPEKPARHDEYIYRAKESAPTQEELEGAKMIIELQKFANITETQETALRGWRNLSESEKRTTRLAYDTITRAAAR